MISFNQSVQILTADNNYTSSKGKQHSTYANLSSPLTVWKNSLRESMPKRHRPRWLPSWILQAFCHILAKPVCAIFNSSVCEGYVSPLWKSATVCALPKKQSVISVESDLRPISLTPTLSKGLET